MSARPPPPHFTMTRAATPTYLPPVGAPAPVRADLPVRAAGRQENSTHKPVAGVLLPPPVSLTTDVPAPQVSQQARLIVVGIVLWVLLCGIAVIGLSARAYVTHAPPPAPTPCVVAVANQCVIETHSGEAVVYWVPWSLVPGIATVTPTPSVSPGSG